MKIVIKVTLRCGVKKKSIVITIMDFTVTINSTTTSKGKKPLPATHDQHKELIRRLFIRYNKLIFLIVLKSMYTNLSECRHYCTHWAEHPKESRIPISNQWQLHLIVESIAVSLFTDRIRSKSKEQSGDETSRQVNLIVPNPRWHTQLHSTYSLKSKAYKIMFGGRQRKIRNAE